MWERFLSPGIWPLDAKGGDEDVDDDDDEDERRGNVLQDVELVVRALVVQVPLHCGERRREGESEGSQGGVREESALWLLRQRGVHGLFNRGESHGRTSGDCFFPRLDILPKLKHYRDYV